MIWEIMIHVQIGDFENIRIKFGYSLDKVVFQLYLNPVWHDVGKQEKCSSLEPPDWCKFSPLKKFGNFWKNKFENFQALQD